MSNPTAPAHENRAHARYSPSTLYYREMCPGWASSNDTNPYALEGTMMHEAAESRNLSGLNKEQLWCVNLVLDYGDEIVLEYPKAPLDLLEEKLRIPYSEFGTADRCIIAPKNLPPSPWTNTAHVIDYKFGRNPVPDAEINPQGWAYALGIFEKYEWITRVTVHFLLPRLDQVSTHTFRKEDIPRMLARIANIVGKCKEHTPEDLALNPGCKYCAKLVGCPAATKTMIVLAERYDEDHTLKLPEGSVHGSMVKSPEVMSYMLQVAPIVEKWTEGVKKAALEMRLEDGVDIPGYLLASRQNERKITVPQAAWDLFKDFGGDEIEFVASSKVSLPQLLDALAAKAPRGSKEKVKQAFISKLTDMGAVSQGDPSFFLRKEK